MSTLTDPGYPTLLNVMKSLAPDGSPEMMIANTLTKKLPLLKDIPWVEGNLPTGDRVTSVLGLPSPTWRKANQGVAPTKVENNQFDESCGLLEDYSKVDVQVAALNGNPAAYRASQDKVKQEMFSQELERAVFYESAVSHPERIHGLTARYPASTGYTSSNYVMPVGTLSGTNCESVWYIAWDPERICGIFPRGSKAGLEYEDLGKLLVPDQNNLQFLAWVSHYVWKCGIRVKDYRYAVRMQWDPDDATNFADNGKQMYLSMQNMLTQVFERLPSGRFYLSRTSFKKLTAQLAANSTNYLQYIADGNEMIPSFLGTPIRITDSLVGESAIS